MKIKSVSFENRLEEWKFEKIDFFQFTLLVGLTGVGKSQILDAIETLSQIARGNPKNNDGVKWEVQFEANSGIEYFWSGEFEIRSYIPPKKSYFLSSRSSDDEKTEKPTIISEKLYTKSEVIIERDQDSFVFNGTEMPKLDATQSSLSILKNEELLHDINNSFRNIFIKTGQIRDDRDEYIIPKISGVQHDDFLLYSDLFTARYIGGSLSVLCFAYFVHKEMFNNVKRHFLEIFPQLEDLEIEKIRDLETTAIEICSIKIKEKKGNTWIHQQAISSGMLKTLAYIADIYFMPKGSVILIDEFENSLGFNCLNVITEDLIDSRQDVQFILTSHHPYIINKIPYQNWKIVNRNGGTIHTFDAKDHGFGESHHDQFIKLINSSIYNNDY